LFVRGERGAVHLEAIGFCLGFGGGELLLSPQHLLDQFFDVIRSRFVGRIGEVDYADGNLLHINGFCFNKSSCSFSNNIFSTLTSFLITCY
jgi:hypothetical protein